MSKKLKKIKKNQFKRAIQNTEPCGFCTYCKRKDGDLEGRCLLKDKTVSIANYELHSPESEDCFRFNEEIRND